MSISSTKGLKIWMETTTAPEETTIAAGPNVSKAKPTVVKVTDTSKLVEGELITFSGTDFPELDGQLYVVANIIADTSFELMGGDTTTSSGINVGAAGKAISYPVAGLDNLCLSSIDISPGSPNTIDISTFCTPGASLPGNPTPGSMTFNGFTDIASKGYASLLQAEADGKARMLKIDIPNNGYLVGKVVVGSVSWGVPLEGSTTYSFAATMSTPMKHVF